MISNDGHGNCVTEFTFGRFGRGGGQSFFRASCGVAGGMFFFLMLVRQTDVRSWTSHLWQADRIGDEFLLRPGPTGATD